MKKVIVFIQTLIIISLSSIAQDASYALKNEYKFFAALTGGPSMPVGNFRANKVSSANNEPGFAEFGYNLNIHTGYQITPHYGIASTIFYSRYTLDVSSLNLIKTGILPANATISADHWQYYGLLAGPMGTVPLTSTISLDIKFLAGIARANFPVFEFAHTPTQEKWTNAFAWQGGTNLRYNFTPKACFFTNLDYNFMKPIWTLNDTTDGQTATIDVEQKMGVIDLNVGLGIYF